MVKREFAANPDIDVDAPRSKRRKDAAAEPSATDDGDMPDQGASSEHENDNGAGAAEAASALSPEEVREEGSKVLQVLKDAVDKEGRLISYDFLRLPSKRQFPDYYEVIKRPIALDDIKAQLDNHTYSSLEVLRQDVETCFKNAKKYNQRESGIWKDAKALQKLANKEIDKILRKGDEDNEVSEKEGGKRKEKGVNITRLMKNRLQKLVAKTDEDGRQLSPVFMDLPSKKKWPYYYKQINRPICIEDIFKRIKRKEYHTIPDFINDVDLVFANAMQFNEEYSPIWQDAVTLKAYFHELMNDLPAKYNMNGAVVDPSASPQIPHNKIKLKLPNHQSAVHGGIGDTAHNGDTSSATVRLRVPGLGGSGTGTNGANTVADKQANATPAKKIKANSPSVPTVSLPPAASIPYSSHTSIPPSTLAPAPAPAPAPALAMPTPKPAKAAIPAHVKPAPSVQPTSQQQQQPSSYTPFHQYTTPNHIPSQSFYTPPVPAPSQTPARGSATPAPSAPTPATTTGRTDAPSPVPPASAAELYSVRLECCLSGKSQVRRRLAVLDARAGVRNFAVHVPVTKAKLVVRAIKFTLHEADGEGGEASEAEEEAKVAQPPVKKRGRGRPRKVIPIDQEVHPPVEAQTEAPPPVPMPGENVKKEKPRWRVPDPTEVLVQLDGQEVTPSPKDSSTTPAAVVNGNGDSSAVTANAEKTAKPEDEWTVEVTAGQHVLEIGRKGNNVHWRVYLCVV